MRYIFYHIIICLTSTIQYISIITIPSNSLNIISRLGIIFEDKPLLKPIIIFMLKYGDRLPNLKWELYEDLLNFKGINIYIT